MPSNPVGPICTPGRSAVLATVARRIVTPPHGRRLAVAIDGVDGAGKTRFADELAVLLGQAGHAVVRASVDGFLRPRSQRYARGRSSPEGYFHDSHDLAAFQRDLLDGFALGGDGRFRRAVFDGHADVALDLPYERAAPRAILLVDGIFLHRDELADRWDMSVFLQVPPDVALARMAARDGTDADPAAPENRRYLDAQTRYLDVCAPAGRATIVVDNTEVAAPVLLRTDGPSRTNG